MRALISVDWPRFQSLYILSLDLLLFQENVTVNETKEAFGNVALIKGETLYVRLVVVEFKQR